jgi:AraC-like DNA-binding protein
LAKIALDSRLLAQGSGWAVRHIVCGSGPGDRPYEERHSSVAIAIVLGGTFQYRSRNGNELMTPGSLLLGSPGEYFECGHQHGTGDRCISVSYDPEFFEPLAAAAVGAAPGFHALRLPPLRALSPLIARASAAVAQPQDGLWEELVLQLARQALELDSGRPSAPLSGEAGALARVTRVVRMMEQHPGMPHTLASLAREARLSPFHFLRTFERLTAVTPHQYLLRARLRQAAVRLAGEPAKILDIAFDSGFGDISNFNRTFRAEFGLSPRAFRSARTKTSPVAYPTGRAPRGSR